MRLYQSEERYTQGRKEDWGGGDQGRGGGGGGEWPGGVGGTREERVERGEGARGRG